MNSTRSACPNAHLLADFCHGRLSEAEGEKIASHVGVCPLCLDSLSRIGPSSLESQLRKSHDESSSEAPADGDADLLKRTLSLLRQAASPDLSRFAAARFKSGKLHSTGRLVERWEVASQAETPSRFLSLAQPELISSELHHRQFFSDVQQAMQLNHPNCEAIRDFGFWEDRRPYYESFGFESVPLDRLLGEPRLPTGICVQWIQGVAAGLKAAHQVGIIHRHVEPNAVLVAADGTPIVVEFGLLYDQRYELDLITGGNPDEPHFAPECRDGNLAMIDVRSDVFGLGRLTALLFKRCPDLPAAFVSSAKSLVADSLHVSRRKRPQTVSSFMERLMSACEVLAR